MSRTGKKPVVVPQGVKVEVDGRHVRVEGPKGKLELETLPVVTVTYDAEASQIQVDRVDDSRHARAMHGTTRALIQNMVTGVTQGYEKRLEIVGVGYLAAVQQGVLQLRVGFANELQVPIPEGLEVTCPDQQHVSIKGADKQKVNHFAAYVRSLRKPEPYKGKGIRYEGEAVRRKEGK
ncbi:MAG: 50S ribosomal protein L6, partial [Planctomycetota bacterium]